MAKKYDATPQEINFYENDVEAEEAPQGLQVADQSLSFYEDPANPAQALPEELPWYRSIPNAVGKAAVNGLVGFGKAFGPLPEDNRAQLINYLNQQGGQGQQQQSFEQYTQQNTPQQVGDFLNRQLPTNEGFAENTIARAGNILPFLLTGGIGGAAAAESRAAGGALAEGLGLTSGALKDVLLQRAKDIIGPIGKSLRGGAAGATAETYGLPEWAQGLAEAGGLGLPELSKRLLPNARQAPLVQEARSLGLTDAEITPLIQSPSKANAFGLFAEKRFRTPAKLQASRDAVTRTYDGLANRPEAKQALNEFQFQRLNTDIQDKIKNMPAGVREIISTDMQDLLNSKRTGNDIINFYRDLNYYIADPARKASQLGTLKGPITTALAQLSPELARDFNTTNTLYANYQNIASKLRPSTSSDLIQAGKAYAFLQGAITGNFPVLAGAVGSQGAGMLASEVLTNPRFQNLSQQMISALNKAQVPVAKRVLENMTQLIREIQPELAGYFQSINLNYLPQILRKRTEETQEEDQ